MLAAVSFTSMGQSKIVQDFKPVCEILDSLLLERTDVGHVEPLALKAVMKRGTTLDFYFTESSPHTLSTTFVTPFSFFSKFCAD